MVKYFVIFLKKQLAILIHDRFRLFGEKIQILADSAFTIEELNKILSEEYDLDWSNLSKNRKRMDWLEVLDSIQGVGDRK